MSEPLNARPSDAQLRYAKIIQWGARIGFALLITGYAVWLAGWNASNVVGLIGIGVLSGISGVGLLSIVLHAFRAGDRWLAIMAALQVLVLATAASGLIAGGG